MVQWLVQELLDLEFTDFLGVEPYERSNDRHGYRKGHRSLDMKVLHEERAEAIELIEFEEVVA